MFGAANSCKQIKETKVATNAVKHFTAPLMRHRATDILYYRDKKETKGKFWTE